MANLFMRFPGMRDRALTFSYDNGVEGDTRLIGMFHRCGLKGAFNLNTGLFAPEGTVYPPGTVQRRMSRSQALAAFTDCGMEIGVHATRHSFLAHTTSSEVVSEILRDREELERMFGGIINGCAYPYGDYDDRTVEALRACGIAYARTIARTGGFSVPTDWLQWHPTCHHADRDLRPLGQKFLGDKIVHDPYLFCVWGHTFDLDGADNWYVMEEFTEAMSGHGDVVWYATPREIYQYVTSYRQMVFSADGHTVCNPTVVPLYFVHDGTPVTLASGETKRI